MSTGTDHPRLQTLLRRLIEHFHGQHPLRTGSLLITVFGDVIHPRGGAVWLSDLLSLMERFGLSQRLVRTSLTRLAHDNWFNIEQTGRRSVYRLSDAGARRVQQASGRIYGDPRRRWNGRWIVVVLAPVPADQREELRRQLEQAGLRSATPNTYLAPESPEANLAVQALQTRFEVLVLRDALAAIGSAKPLERWILDRWDILDISNLYIEFMKQFQDALAVMPGPEDATEALILRVMLIHHYRRLVLRDPGLPNELLPTDWAGLRAYQLTRSCYETVLAASEHAVDELLGTPWGNLPPRAAGVRSFDSESTLSYI